MEPMTATRRVRSQGPPPVQEVRADICVAGAGIAGISVWLQTVALLLAPADKRFPLMALDWPEEAARKKRISLGEETEEEEAARRARVK